MSDSGNAEAVAPQLHFEIKDSDLNDPLLTYPLQSKRLNPYPSLQAALDHGDVPPATPSSADDATLPSSAWVFDDVAPDDTHAEAIAETGITDGCTEDDFCPNRTSLASR